MQDTLSYVPEMVYYSTLIRVAKDKKLLFFELYNKLQKMPPFARGFEIGIWHEVYDEEIRNMEKSTKRSKSRPHRR